jgi:mono/diheme cytochrome c family protein
MIQGTGKGANKQLARRARYTERATNTTSKSDGIIRIARICELATAFSALLTAAPLAVFPIDEQSIAQVRKGHQIAFADVDDPVYKRKQRYQGIWLLDILKDLRREGHPESETYLRFRCKDGYAPMMPLARALRGRGLVAFRDTGAPGGEDWRPLPGSENSATPAPSYLVWVSPPGDPDEFPWPYQMVAIELVSSSEALAGLSPGTSQAGQQLFVSHCLKCHAINGVGGTLGPELNSPCSVTEYWNARLLHRFIAKASSVRHGTKMPDFDTLPDKDIESIVDYLHSMAGHKSSGAACP